MHRVPKVIHFPPIWTETRLSAALRRKASKNFSGGRSGSRGRPRDSRASFAARTHDERLCGVCGRPFDARADRAAVRATMALTLANRLVCCLKLPLRYGTVPTHSTLDLMLGTMLRSRHLGVIKRHRELSCRILPGTLSRIRLIPTAKVHLVLYSPYILLARRAFAVMVANSADHARLHARDDYQRDCVPPPLSGAPRA